MGSENSKNKVPPDGGAYLEGLENVTILKLRETENHSKSHWIFSPYDLTLIWNEFVYATDMKRESINESEENVDYSYSGTIYDAVVDSNTPFRLLITKQKQNTLKASGILYNVSLIFNNETVYSDGTQETFEVIDNFVITNVN